MLFPITGNKMFLFPVSRFLAPVSY